YEVRGRIGLEAEGAEHGHGGEAFACGGGGAPASLHATRERLTTPRERDVAEQEGARWARDPRPAARSARRMPSGASAREVHGTGPTNRGGGDAHRGGPP